MIFPDLTEVLLTYGHWDYVIRNKYLRFAADLIRQHQRIIYKETEYHNVEDLKADLEAEFIEQANPYY